MSNTIGLSGEYNFVIKHEDGTQTETGWFRNMILDRGLRTIIEYSSSNLPNNGMLGACYVGDGTAQPAATQLGIMGTLKGSAGVVNQSATVTYLGSPTYAREALFQYIFPLGNVVGTIAEVVIALPGYATSAGFSRALITDGSGNPTTLTLSATDQLTVYYKLTIAPQLTDITGSVVLDGITYNFVGRASNVSNWLPSGVTSNALSATYGYLQSQTATTRSFLIGGPTSVIGSITGSPSNTVAGDATSCTLGAVTSTANGFYRDVTFTWVPGAGNVAGGIKTLRHGNGSNDGNTQYCFFQYEFDTPIPKINTQTLTLTFRFALIRA